MVNKAIIIGRLGGNPEVRNTTGGASVSSFSVATSEKWTDKSGEKQERTEWHRIVAWGKLAEICAQYLTKGSLAYIEGRIQTRAWEDKDGVTKYTTEIQASEIKFLSTKNGQQSSGDRPGQRMQPEFTEDDIPF